MAALSDALHHLHESELTRNEDLIRAGWNGEPVIGGSDTNGVVGHFIEFCRIRNIRYLPANPYTVALFVKSNMHVRPEIVLDILRSIEELHDAHGAANPCATHPVRCVLRELIGEQAAPRSWKKDEKILFAQLPSHIQMVIAKREADREKELRRAQNAAAAKRHTDEAAMSKIVDQNQKEISTMAKERTVEGAYSDAKKALKDMTHGAEFDEKSKSIAGRVEDAASENGGLSGKLGK